MNATSIDPVPLRTVAVDLGLSPETVGLLAGADDVKVLKSVDRVTGEPTTASLIVRWFRFSDGDQLARLEALFRPVGQRYELYRWWIAANDGNGPTVHGEGRTEKGLRHWLRRLWRYPMNQ